MNNYTDFAGIEGVEYPSICQSYRLLH